MSFMRKNIKNKDKSYDENEGENNEMAVALFIGLPAIIMGSALIFFIIIDRLSSSFK